MSIEIRRSIINCSDCPDKYNCPYQNCYQNRIQPLNHKDREKLSRIDAKPSCCQILEVTDDNNNTKTYRSPKLEL